jgi:hypothetical protein
MNYANVDFLLDVLTLVVALAIAFGAAMLGSFLLFTLPAWIRRWARRRALMRAPLAGSSHATVRALHAPDRNLREARAHAHEQHKDRWTA